MTEKKILFIIGISVFCFSNKLDDKKLLIKKLNQIFEQNRI